MFVVSGEIGGEIGKDNIGPGAADGEETFVATLVEVEEAEAGGGVDLCVFAADLISGEGEVGD